MINKTYDDKMVAWLEKNREKILAKWMELIRIPSVQGTPLPNAPFGEDCARALKTAAGYLAELGIDVKLNEQDGYAVAKYAEGKKCLGLFGHSDVVPAGDGWIYTEPFQPIIRDGLLIGRGASDNKSGIMASWCVVAMLKELGIPVQNRIEVFVGSNEESGMKDMEAYVRNETPPDLCLVPDSQFPCGLGEKGILRMWAKCDRPFTAVRNMKGGNAFNIVLDLVETELAPNEALAKELQEKCAGNEKFVLTLEQDGTIRLQANGFSKHAAYPVDSLNATWLTAQLLTQCQHLPAGDRVVLETVKAYLDGYSGEGLQIAHEDPDFGALTCANGMVKVEDGHLMVSLDIRYGITCDPQELEQKLYSGWEAAGWQITYMENRPGYAAAPDSPYPAEMKAVAEELAGRQMNYYRMPGGTYGRYVKNAFPVGTCIRLTEPTLPMPAGHGGAHQRDESISIEGFFLGVRALAHEVLACDRILAEQK